MEFKFPVNDLFKQPIVEISHTLIPEGFSGDRRALWDSIGKVSEVVNAMGEASAHAQGLTKPITTADRLRNSEHNIYLLIDQQAGNGRGAVTGMLKTGKKGLYVFDRNGEHFQVSPPCVLDFYIHESRQRTGLGKRLFEHMLEKEQIQPVKMAIDRPSEKFLAFLNKYYGLNSPVKQMNNYVVFDGFFPNSQENGKVENNSDNSRGKKLSANGLQAFTTPTTNTTPLGRYGAPRPHCSMGQIIHNQTSTLQKSAEPTGVQSVPTLHYQYPTTSPTNSNIPLNMFMQQPQWNLSQNQIIPPYNGSVNQQVNSPYVMQAARNGGNQSFENIQNNINLKYHSAVPQNVVSEPLQAQNQNQQYIKNLDLTQPNYIATPAVYSVHSQPQQQPITHFATPNQAQISSPQPPIANYFYTEMQPALPQQYQQQRVNETGSQQLQREHNQQVIDQQQSSSNKKEEQAEIRKSNDWYNGYALDEEARRRRIAIQKQQKASHPHLIPSQAAHETQNQLYTIDQIPNTPQPHHVSEQITHETQNQAYTVTPQEQHLYSSQQQLTVPSPPNQQLSQLPTVHQQIYSEAPPSQQQLMVPSPPNQLPKVQQQIYSEARQVVPHQPTNMISTQQQLETQQQYNTTDCQYIQGPNQQSIVVPQPNLLQPCAVAKEQLQDPNNQHLQQINTITPVNPVNHYPNVVSQEQFQLPLTGYQQPPPNLVDQHYQFYQPNIITQPHLQNPAVAHQPNLVSQQQIQHPNLIGQQQLEQPITVSQHHIQQPIQQQVQPQPNLGNQEQSITVSQHHIQQPIQQQVQPQPNLGNQQIWQQPNQSYIVGQQHLEQPNVITQQQWQQPSTISQQELQQQPNNIIVQQPSQQQIPQTVPYQQNLGSATTFIPSQQSNIVQPTTIPQYNHQQNVQSQISQPQLINQQNLTTSNQTSIEETNNTTVRNVKRKPQRRSQFPGQYRDEEENIEILKGSIIKEVVNKSNDNAAGDVGVLLNEQLRFGYPPQLNDIIQTVEEVDLSSKLERPQSLSIQLDEDNDQKAEDQNDAIESEVQNSENQNVVDNNEIDIQEEIHKKLSINENEAILEYDTNTKIVSKSPDRPSHLTDQGFFDLKFYHNKLW